MPGIDIQMHYPITAGPHILLHNAGPVLQVIQRQIDQFILGFAARVIAWLKNHVPDLQPPLQNLYSLLNRIEITAVERNRLG